MLRQGFRIKIADPPCIIGSPQVKTEAFLVKQGINLLITLLAFCYARNVPTNLRSIYFPRHIFGSPYQGVGMVTSIGSRVEVMVLFAGMLIFFCIATGCLAILAVNSLV